MLSGSLESDKIFEEGDIAHVVVSYSGDKIGSAVSDHYRLDKEILLAGMFVALLIAFAGWTGLRAVYSFVITILTIWKVLVPAYLAGVNPVWCGILITAFLTLMIIFLVYGFDRKTVAAVSGAFLGILVTCIMGCIFTDTLRSMEQLWLIQKVFLFWIPGSKSDKDFYERDFYRGFRSHDGSGCGYYLCSK